MSALRACQSVQRFIGRRKERANPRRIGIVWGLVLWAFFVLGVATLPLSVEVFTEWDVANYTKHLGAMALLAAAMFGAPIAIVSINMKKLTLDIERAREKRDAPKGEAGGEVDQIADDIPPKAEIYIDTKGDWRWRILAENGEVIANASEGYVSREACLRGLQAASHALNVSSQKDSRP